MQDAPARLTRQREGLLRRAGRYLGAYLWLFKQQFAVDKLTFPAFLLCAVAGQIFAVGGLIAGAHFLAHLVASAKTHAHHVILGVQISNTEYKVAVVAIPILLLLMSAAFQAAALKLFARLVEGVTGAIARDYDQRLANANAGATPLPAAAYHRLATLLVRVEMRFVTLIQSLLVLCCAALGSVMLVGALPTLLLVLLLVAFMAGVLVMRQGHAHDLRRQQNELDAQRTQLVREAGGALPSKNERARQQELFAQISDNASTRFSLAWSFKELSRIFAVLIQAILVGGILLYIATMGELDPATLAHLVSLFLIMRFSFGAVQQINTATLAIAPDYPALVRIMNGRDYRDQNEPGMPSVDGDDDDRLL